MNDIVKIFGDARIAFRSDTLENWQKENPVLLSGEFSVVTDGTETEKVKIGDGIHNWNDLPWWKGPKGDKGDKGQQGEKGEQGFRGIDGNDGTPATHSWNGTTLTITSASGTSSANLKGEKGDKGEQGIQGKDGQDYVLTESDKREIADMVDVPDIDADLSDYAKKEYVDDTVGDVETALDEIIEIQESLKDEYTGSVSKEYVDGIAAEAGQSINYIMENYVSMQLLNQIVGVLEENYATKQYVEDYINEALGGEY